jgi:signal transduction histidine kinase
MDPTTDSDVLTSQAEALLREIEGSQDPARSAFPSVVRILKLLYERVKLLERERAELTDHVAASERTNLDFRESIDDLIRVQELSGAISGSLDLEAILSALAYLTRQVVPYEDFGVFEVQEERDAFAPISVKAGRDTFVDGVRQFWKDGIVRWAIQQGNPTIVPDPESATAEGGKDEGAGRSFVIVPMRGMGRCVGVFVLACTKPQDAFTAGEMDLIALLARQAAIALENAHLYQSLEDTNRKLRDSQNQLVQAGKLAAVGQLAGGVAHEVNNPLQIILSRVQLLMMRHREVPRLQEDLRLIESNVKRISKIIRSLLDFARYNSGEAEWSPVDVGHLARQTCTLIQHQVEKGGVALSIDAPADLPKVFANPGEIEQVFLNLLLNAQHATPSGGRIDIRIRADRETVTVSVADTGTGIPKDLLPKIFEPFFTTRSAEGGTGLGLSIIYGILEKHHGRIEVESEPGAGATFTFHLPIDSIGS